MEHNVDICEKVIRSIDDDVSDEVVIILSKETLLKTGIEIGDPIRIVARPNELVIRKEQCKEGR